MINKKIKILILNTEFYRGGAAKIARTLFYNLKVEDNFDCYFSHGRGKQPEDQKVIKLSYLPEVYLHGVLTRLLGLQGYGTFFSTKKLEKYILKEKFDLIHLHNIHGYYIDLSLINFLTKIKIPIVWTLHDMWPLTGRCAYPFFCNKWRTGCENCEDLTSYPRAFIDTTNFMWRKKKNIFLTQWNPIIVSPSNWLAGKVKDSFLNNFQIKVITNGINTNLFKPGNKIKVRKKYGISNNKKVILYVAADLRDQRKGVKYFLESLNYINKENYVVITLGKKINDNKLLRLNLDIKQMGYIDNEEDLAEIYSMAYLYSITSLDENFPTTVLESMACGVPVVGFEVGGIPEQVSEDCGIMVEPKNTKALGNALNRLLEDDELRNRFSENCRKRVLKNYTIEKFVNNYINTYNELLRRQK